jgi:glycosyltransferase involved in cell wall biosynthesis
LYDRERGVADDIDAIVATAWETAYPAYLDPSHARRLYLVQDFEPMFYPTGTNSVLAENTYRFGFTGLTAGGWLRKKLNTEYGMETRHFDFAVDPDIYRLLDGVTRDGVFFYARRETPRRGFDLGMAALHEFHRIMPEVPIHLAGAHVDDFEVPFPFTMHSGLSLTELNALYSRCKAGLVISLTNMSLLPLELVAAGTQVVMNDGPNNREVSTNEFIHYVPAVPHELARALVRLMGASESAATRREISDSSRQRTWDDSGRQFVSAFEGVMRD